MANSTGLPLLSEIPAWSPVQLRRHPRRFGDDVIEGALDAASAADLAAARRG